MILSFIALQRSLGVNLDDAVGRATLSALLIALLVFVYHIVKLEEQGVHQHE